MKNKGFTLIELLVVIAIIGILAGVVLSAISSCRESGACTEEPKKVEGVRPMMGN